MVQLFAVDVSPLKQEKCFKLCYQRSSKARQQKADALKMQEDKERCIAAGLLLVYAYKTYMKEKTKELALANSFGGCKTDIKLPEIVIDKGGKPHFALDCKNEGAEVCFNLSHSGQYVLCAIGDQEMGVDLQQMVPVRESLVKRYFTDAEQQFVKNGAEKAFAAVWTKKEAIAKLTGRGIAQILEKDNIQEGISVTVGEIGQEYSYAVAVYDGELELTVSEVFMVNEGELFYEGDV